ncbi:UNVERIFIED_ORG: hypothetical protein QFZ59_002514 [Bacillus sp. B2I3]|nr:hypothetical protein [Bacillus sp. B2I3]
MGNKSPGRNTTLTIDEVRVVITSYRTNVQPMGNIEYSKIHSHANDLYDKRLISKPTSDAFWRKIGRLGRVEVDMANKVFSQTVAVSKGKKKITIPNVVDLVHKRYKDKENLLKHLILMENDFHDSVDREKKLEKKISALEETIQENKDKLQVLTESNEQLQGLVYRLFRSLSQTKDEEVQRQTEYAMNTIFSTPTAFADFLGRNERNEESQKEPQVLPFGNIEPNNRASNRFRK